MGTFGLQFGAGPVGLGGGLRWRVVGGTVVNRAVNGARMDHAASPAETKFEAQLNR